MVVQFESRLVRITIDAGRVCQQVVLKGLLLAAAFSSGSKQLGRHNDRGFASEFYDFSDRLRVPRTQLLGYNISVLAGSFRHDFESRKRRLFMPVQRALFPEIEVTN